MKFRQIVLSVLLVLSSGCDDETHPQAFNMPDGTQQDFVKSPVLGSLGGKFVNCVWVAYLEGHGWYTGPNASEDWYFNEDGTGSYYRYRLLVDGSFVWQKQADNTHNIQYINLPSSDGILPLSDQNEDFVIINYGDDVRYIAVPDNGQLDGSYACQIKNWYL